MELHEYTDKDIKAEYLRRKRLRNGEWYFAPYDDEPDPEWRSEKPEFVIVNRRLWHLTKRISQFSITKNISLPKGFTEMNSSHFVYSHRIHKNKGTDFDKAVKKLEDYHFVRLEQSLEQKQYLVTQKFAFVMTNGARKFAYWVCDTLELKAILEAWINAQKNVTYDDFDDFHFEAGVFAAQHNCVAHHYNTYQDTHVALLKREVFEGLPESPYKKILRPGNELP